MCEYKILVRMMKIPGHLIHSVEIKSDNLTLILTVFFRNEITYANTLPFCSYGK